MNYIVIADTTSDNQPLGVMIVDTPDIELTIKQVFEQEENCDHVRYIKMFPDFIENGMMFDWTGFDVAYKEGSDCLVCWTSME